MTNFFLYQGFFMMFSLWMRRSRAPWMPPAWLLAHELPDLLLGLGRGRLGVVDDHEDSGSDDEQHRHDDGLHGLSTKMTSSPLSG